jgi:hypothetical protein
MSADEYGQGNLFSKPGLEAKRNALEALSLKNKTGNGTKNATKTDFPSPQSPILGIKMVGACGFEPQTPTVSRCARRISITSTLPFVNEFNPERLEKNTVKGIDGRGSQAKVRQIKENLQGRCDIVLHIMLHERRSYYISYYSYLSSGLLTPFPPLLST